MEIIISSNTSKPIYEQITSQIKALIMSGELFMRRRNNYEANFTSGESDKTVS